MFKKEVRILQTINRTCNCQIGYLTVEYSENDVLSSNFLFKPDIDEPICMIDIVDDNTIYYNFDTL